MAGRSGGLIDHISTFITAGALAVRRPDAVGADHLPGRATIIINKRRLEGSLEPSPPPRRAAAASKRPLPVPRPLSVRAVD